MGRFLMPPPLRGASHRNFVMPTLTPSRQSLGRVLTTSPRLRKSDADLAKVLTMDEARRVSSNIANLPTLLPRK